MNSKNFNLNYSKFTCWKNGKLVNPDQAAVSVYDHGLLYGDGCFEGIRFYRKQPFRISQHLQRLRRSLCSLNISIPYTDKTLSEAVQACVETSGLRDGYIRLLITRGEGDMGLDPRNCGDPNVIIISASLSLVGEEDRKNGVNLITSSIRRTVGTGLDTRVKSLNYLHSILARIEANAAGVDEAILLNQFGNVAECTAENIFAVTGNSLLTPPTRDGALEGVTRGAILELAAEESIICREESLSSYDLYNATECFICGSGAGLIPVRFIDGREIAECPGPMYKWMVKAYRKLIDKECGRH